MSRRASVEVWRRERYLGRAGRQTANPRSCSL